MASDAQDLSFSVLGTTATITDPGNGGSIDVNVLNKRNWIDVTFARAGGPDPEPRDDSITDLAPEFTLTGTGLGTLALDGARRRRL